MRSYLINLLNGLFIASISLYLYFSDENQHPSTLIPAMFGGVFLSATPVMKRRKIFAILTITLLTLVLSILLLFRISIFNFDFSTRSYLILCMSASCMIAVLLYVLNLYIALKKRIFKRFEAVCGFQFCARD